MALGAIEGAGQIRQGAAGSRSGGNNVRQQAKTVLSMGSRTDTSMSQESVGSSQAERSQGSKRMTKIPHINRGNTRPIFDHFEDQKMNDIDEEEMMSSSSECPNNRSLDDHGHGLGRPQGKARRTSMEAYITDDRHKKELNSHFESINEVEDSASESDLETMSVQEELQGYFDGFGQFRYKNFKYRKERKKK